MLHCSCCVTVLLSYILFSCFFSNVFRCSDERLTRVCWLTYTQISAAMKRLDQWTLSVLVEPWSRTDPVVRVLDRRWSAWSWMLARRWKLSLEVCRPIASTTRNRQACGDHQSSRLMGCVTSLERYQTKISLGPVAQVRSHRPRRSSHRALAVKCFVSLLTNTMKQRQLIALNCTKLFRLIAPNYSTTITPIPASKTSYCLGVCNLLYQLGPMQFGKRRNRWGKFCQLLVCIRQAAAWDSGFGCDLQLHVLA